MIVNNQTDEPRVLWIDNRPHSGWYGKQTLRYSAWAYKPHDRKSTMGFTPFTEYHTYAAQKERADKSEEKVKELRLAMDHIHFKINSCDYAGANDILSKHRGIQP